MSRLRTVLLGLTVVLLAVSAIALLIRPSVESGDAVTPPSLLNVPTVDDSVMSRHVAAIVRGNLFDADRETEAAR